MLALAVLALLLVARAIPSLVLAGVVAGAVYYLFAPLVDRLERRGAPRLLGVALSYALLLGALGFFIAAAAPRVYLQARNLSVQAPEYARRLEELVLETDLAGENADPRVREAVHTLVARSDQVALDALGQVATLVGGVFSSLVTIVFGLVLGFYLLLSGPSLAAGAAAWFPPAERERWTRFGRQVSDVLAGYLRARLIASLLIGISYTVAFTLIGLNESILLGTLGGLLNFVPLIGPLLAAIPAIVVALFESWKLALVVLVIMVVAQQLESSVLNPHVEGRYVRLPAVVILIVAVAGGTLAGLPGLLLATPAAGVVRAALDVFYRAEWQAAGHSSRDADGSEAE